MSTRLVPVLVVWSHGHITRVEPCGSDQEASGKLEAALKDKANDGSVYSVSDPAQLGMRVGDPVPADGSDEMDFRG